MTIPSPYLFAQKDIFAKVINAEVVFTEEDEELISVVTQFLLKGKKKIF
jgi:hypothetical protein